MVFVTSRNVALPDSPEGLTNGVWFNLWPNKLWPYNELEIGATLYWYHSPSRCIVWRSRVVDVNRFAYRRKDEVKENLQLTTPQAAESYFANAPESGFCLAYRVEALERMSLPKPDDFRFPQQGWLKITDDVAHEWSGLTSTERSMFPKYRDIEMPLLHELIRRGGSAEPADPDNQGRSIYTALADLFGLSEAEREERTEGGEDRLHWERMVRWARQKLLDKGLLTSNRRGIWQVTPEGREFVQAELEATREAIKDRDSFFPEEVAERDRSLAEGAVRRVLVNAYERNPEARRLCIAHYGPICCICKFNFGNVYGKLVDGFIHVHHLRSLSEVGEEYAVDPIRDLRPVCPNCHAVLHLHGKVPAYRIEEVQTLLGGHVVKAVRV